MLINIMLIITITNKMISPLMLASTSDFLSSITLDDFPSSPPSPHLWMFLVEDRDVQSAATHTHTYAMK